MRPQRLSLHFAFAVHVTIFLLIGVDGYAGENRTLAQVCAAYGVSEETNTMLHVTERDAKGSYGRKFFLPNNNAEQVGEMGKLWQALSKTQFIETRIKEPKEPFIFVVLNTGTSSKKPPTEEIWIDAEGQIYFLPDNEKRPREFMVFSGPEVVAWANDNMMKYGR